MGMLLRRKKHKADEVPTGAMPVGTTEKEPVKEEKAVKKVVGKAKKEV